MKTRPRPRIRTPRAGITLSADEVIADYRIAVRSRAASVIGRREVLTGKAPFGIFGDGKEVANLAMARHFRDGDWRSGYYRYQTFAFATGMATLAQYFAQLYTDTDVERDPFSAGRQMVSHFGSRNLDADGRWLPAVRMKNSASDLSPVAAQMGRALGLAYASKLYRDGFREVSGTFSEGGNEGCFATIGNAGCAGGIFWEAEARGVDVDVVKGWDYPALLDTYAAAIEKVRTEHAPALIHVVEVTQPQGHSTSGSHERYKNKERLRFETEMDPIARMRDWMIREELATASELDAFEKEDRLLVERTREEAWSAYAAPILAERERAVALLERAADGSGSEPPPELAPELPRATQ